MAAYLRKHKVAFGIERDAERDAEREMAFRKRASELITVHKCHRLEKQKLTFSAQDKIAHRRKPTAEDKGVANALTRMIGTAKASRSLCSSQVCE